MQKQSFDLDWEYTELTGFAALFNPNAWQPVTLPHDAMITKPRAANNPSGNGGAYFPGGVANYRRKFHTPEAWRGQCVQLEFEGVYMNAEVTVNGQLLCIQPYGHSSFVVDNTPHLAYGQDNTVGVVANNTAQPNCRWYSASWVIRKRLESPCSGYMP
jgi:beta-galactosidase